MSRQFDGKSVLITGASRGIGKRLALDFAEQGARCLVVAGVVWPSLYRILQARFLKIYR